MKILITGVDEFIGINLLDFLLENTDYEVVGTSNLSGEIMPNVQKHYQNNRFTHINANLLYSSNFNALPTDITHIVHVPYGATNNESYKNFDRVNVMVNILNFAKENNIKNIIYSIMSNNVGSELFNNEYISIEDLIEVTISKFANLNSRDSNIKLIGLRLSNLFGKYFYTNDVNRNIVHEIISLSTKGNGQYLEYAEEQKHHCTYVGDVLESILDIIANDNLESHIYDCYNPNSLSTTDIVRIIKNLSKKNIDFKYESHLKSETINALGNNIFKNTSNIVESIKETYLFYKNKELKNLIIYLNSLHGVGGAEKYLHTILPKLSEFFNVIVITYENSFHEIFDDHLIYSMSGGMKNLTEVMEIANEYNKEDTIFLSILHHRLDKVYKFFNRCKLVMQWHSIIGDHSSKNGNSYISSHLSNIISFDPQLITVLGENSKVLLKEKYKKESEVFYNVFEDTKYRSNLLDEIVWVGNYRHEKGVDKLIEIINFYRGNLKFKIYGNWSNENLNDFKNKVTEYDKKVTFAGFEHDIEKIYENATIILSTSKVEGWGRVITEANLRGIAAIMAYKSENADEIIENGINGHIVDSGQINMVEYYIEKISKNRQSYSHNSREYAERFLVERNINSMVSKLVQVPLKKTQKFKNVLIYTDQLKKYGGIEDILMESIPKLHKLGFKIYVLVGGDRNQPYLKKGEWYCELEKYIEKTFIVYKAKDKLEFFDWVLENNNSSTFVYVPKYWGFSEFNDLLLNCFIHVEWHGGVEGEYSDHVLKLLRTIKLDTISFLGKKITNKVGTKFPGHVEKLYLPVRYSKEYEFKHYTKVNKMVWVGRYNENKNPYQAIDLAKEILSNKLFKNYTFCMYGEFDENIERFTFDALTNYANDDRIKINSFHEKEDIYSDAKYLLNTSKEEGWGLIFEDAFKYGVVCIAPTWLSSLEEVFEGVKFISYSNNNNCVGMVCDFHTNYNENYEEYISSLKIRNRIIGSQNNFITYIENGYYRNWSKR